MPGHHSQRHTEAMGTVTLYLRVRVFNPISVLFRLLYHDLLDLNWDWEELSFNHSGSVLQSLIMYLTQPHTYTHTHTNTHTHTLTHTHTHTDTHKWMLMQIKPLHKRELKDGRVSSYSIAQRQSGTLQTHRTNGRPDTTLQMNTGQCELVPHCPIVWDSVGHHSLSSQIS